MRVSVSQELTVFIIQVSSQRMCRKSTWEMCVQLVKVKLPQDRQLLEQVYELA